MRTHWLVTGARLALPAVISSMVAASASAAAVAAPAPATPGWTWRNPAPLGHLARGVVRAGPYEYAIGGDRVLLRSDDGGDHWIPLDTGSEEPVERLEVVDQETVVDGNPKGCDARISHDAGASFAPLLVSGPKCTPVAAFSFITPAVGFVLLRDGAVERTTDGGHSFTAVAAVPGSPASIGVVDEARFATYEGLGAEIHFSTAESGTAFLTSKDGTSTAFVTGNAGLSWTQVALPARAEVQHVDFVNATTAYATGTDTLLYSGDGGGSWQSLALPSSSSWPEAVFCGSGGGCLAKLWLSSVDLLSLNGSAPPSSARAPAFPLCAVGGQLPADVIAVPADTSSDDATLLSGEPGEPCTQQSSAPQIGYAGLTQGPGHLVYSLGSNGRLPLSTDEGQSWETIAAPHGTDLSAAAFTSARDGVVLYRDGVVRQTSDGGASWRRIRTATRGSAHAITFTGRDVLVLGAKGIERSRDGGPFELAGKRAKGEAGLSAFEVSGSTVFAYGAHVLLRSIDGGTSWERLPLPPRGPQGLPAIDDISFPTRSDGYALDGYDILWSTRDGGRHWRQVLGAGPSEATSVVFTSTRDGYIAGLLYQARERDAYALRTSDGGATWSPEWIGPGWQDSDLVARGSGAAMVLQEPSAGEAATMIYSTSSLGEAGRPDLSVSLRASRRAIGGRELRLDHGTVPVRVAGTLSTGEAGQHVIVAQRSLSGFYWNQRVVTTGPGGSFSSRWRVGGSSVFVAQWPGEPGQTGAGSKALTITVPSR